MMVRQLPALVIVLWILICLIGFIIPLTPDLIILEKILSPPGQDAWLGFDDLGRPMFDRLVLGARTSILVASSVVSISFFLGTIVGLTAVWLGGWWDKITVIIIDVFIAFPGILLAIALAGLLGPGLSNIIIALSLVGWVGFARLARAQTLTVKRRDHVIAASALGSSSLTIMIKHILPLIMAPLIVEATFAVAGTVIAEASLSFLGLGIQPPESSWGSMIRDGTRYMMVAPHMVVIPGFAISLVILSVNLLGDRLRDLMDIKTNSTLRDLD